MRNGFDARSEETYRGAINTTLSDTTRLLEDTTTLRAVLQTVMISFVVPILRGCYQLLSRLCLHLSLPGCQGV